MVVTEGAVRELIGLAYEAGAEPERWPTFLEKLADAVCNRACMLQVHDLGRADGSLLSFVRCDPAVNAAYNEHYAPPNPWTNNAGDQMQPGTVIVGERVLSRSELQRTEFYADFLRPQDITESMAAVIMREGNTTAFISATGSARWTSENVAVFEMLMPHLCRALALHRRLGSVRQRHEAIIETADRLPWGVIFLDRKGGVCFANVRARRLTRGAFTRVLAVANNGGGLVEGQLAVTVAPLRVERDPLLLTQPVRAVFVVDPDEPRAIPDVLLRRGYGLTPAESRLALALARGETLAEFAESATVRTETLRTHLKRIFAKTGTRRQSELVRLLLLLSCGADDGTP